MVIPDWTSPKPPKIEFVPAVQAPEQLARPLDRLAAAIVDVFVLLVPIYILLSAPFKRAMTASFILGSEPDFIVLIGCMVALGVFMLVSYQAVLHYFFGATVGKMLFDLRVRPMFFEDKLSFVGCVGRSLIWIFEIMTFGLPFLAVFSNSKRRTLHDRIFDTVVVSRSLNGISAPGVWERGLVRGFFGACLLSGTLFGAYQMRHLFEKFKAEKDLNASVEKDVGACEVVSKNINENSSGGPASDHSHLELAMSLYAAGLADRSCLESELEREMALQTPVGAITYLAQAFVNSEDAEVSNSYLDQVCEDSPKTIECTMSQVVSKWSEEDWGSVEELLNSAEKGSGYLEVWAVRHFMKQAHYNQAIGYLDALSDHHELADFSQVQRVKALYNSFQESEATAALAQAIPTLSNDEGADLSSWMCAQQLQNGCAALDKIACRGIEKGHDLSEIDFDHAGEALSRVMALECRAENSVDYLTFSEAVKDEDWQTFFRANLKQQKDDLQASFRLYSQVITSPSAPELLRVEALRRVSKFADRKQLASTFDMWREFDSKEAWMKAGNILFTRFVQKKDQEWAMRVAKHLMNDEALSPKALAQMNEFMLPGATSTTERRPASVPAKEKAKARLQSTEDEP